jgi:Ala-tRNA(Pro) deacylase
MATARRTEDYLTQQGIAYDLLSHPHSHSSMETAEVAHVPGDRLAKCVVLGDEDGYVVAVLPSTQHVRLGKLGRELKRRLRLATEDEVATLFADCERGAVPAVGLAYGVATILDESLAEQPEIYFEAGDHESLIRMKRDAFMTLMAPASHGRFGHRPLSSHRG